MTYELLSVLYLDFWGKFVEYCKTKGRGNDIVKSKCSRSYYNVSIGSSDYYIVFAWKREKLGIGLYVYRPEVFERLTLKKDELEEAYGATFDWHISRKGSVAKQIRHSIDADVRNPNLYPQHFDWLIYPGIINFAAPLML